uniref:Uncharacterized protein n=1 Tax=Leersia perrieri TaxID=77586 RepID=A0A0D9WXZ2_9ORYZ
MRPPFSIELGRFCHKVEERERHVIVRKFKFEENRAALPSSGKEVIELLDILLRTHSAILAGTGRAAALGPQTPGAPEQQA